MAISRSRSERFLRRALCGTDKACILAAYKKQTAPLEAIIANVKTHGPF